MKGIEGIPREAVAFAAGVRAGTQRDWKLIAASLKLVGFGEVDPEALSRAVAKWGMRRLVRIRSAAGQLQVLLVSKMAPPPPRPS